ncbi:hypothetical protein [Kingella oralis]|jgi:hypothetical protein|uniref:hypothetical protein n=1 Tax=Kingella oralis TaxID=505 RepID=UPI0028E5BFAC|nr:hypothetical protein [Kingella oralis]
MKANNYDALLTYARLLSELQSGELEISWQKITPISKQDHLLTRQHLHRLILLGLLLMVTAPLAGFLSFNEQHTVELLFSAAVLFFTIAILKTELPDAIRILRTPIGTMQPENFTLYFIRTRRHKYSYYPKTHYKPVATNTCPIGTASRRQTGKPCSPTRPIPKHCNNSSAPSKNGSPKTNSDVQAA